MNNSQLQHRTTESRKRQRGLSLIELMIGMVISLILIGGMISLFVANKQTYRYNEELARLQENGRFAIDFVERSLRMAGNIGCPELNAPSNILYKDSIATGFDLAAVDAMRAERDTTSKPSGLLPSGKSAKDGTDVVVVTYGSGAAAALEGTTAPGASSLTIKSNALGFTKGNLLLISNCEQVEAFRVTNEPGSGANATLEHIETADYNTQAGLKKGYGPDARVMRLNRQVFFIGPSTEREINRQGTAFNSLYVNDVEMVEGVEDMVVRYGIPATAGGREVSQYVDILSVGDWDDVRAVRVELLLASVDDGAVSEKQTITFNGTTEEMPDRRMYTTYTTTISLRGSID